MSELSALIPKLEAVEAEYEKLAEQMAQPEIASDPERYREAATRYAELEPVVHSLREARRVQHEHEQARQMVKDETDVELREMAKTEVAELAEQLASLSEKLQTLLLPKDPNDEKNVVIEVRAGTGGDEATLFASELVRMYQRYADEKGWTFELMDVSESEVGGIKEVIANISGKGVFAKLKFESGVHRVQRVPETESQGRIHTSAATVAILPEAEDVEVEIDEDKELRIDSFSSSGPGGQSVNRTTSAVRITHIPTNIVVQCQDEKSWHKNRAKAMKVLRARLYDKMMQEQQAKEAAARKGQIGSGDRSEKIRTYNFPQNRVTDHRIHFTLHKLDKMMLGDLDELIEAMITANNAERLKQEVAN